MKVPNLYADLWTVVHLLEKPTSQPCWSCNTNALQFLLKSPKDQHWYKVFNRWLKPAPSQMHSWILVYCGQILIRSSIALNNERLPQFLLIETIPHWMWFLNLCDWLEEGLNWLFKAYCNLQIMQPSGFSRCCHVMTLGAHVGSTTKGCICTEDWKNHQRGICGWRDDELTCVQKPRVNRAVATRRLYWSRGDGGIGLERWRKTNEGCTISSAVDWLKTCLLVE